MASVADEFAVTIPLAGDRLVGVVHGAGRSARGLLVIVGGPQYRVGSHRQFLQLARFLAKRGIPVMRFDRRGMGDAEGESRHFTEAEADICAAIDAFMAHSPGLESVVLWGLCDAASAAMLYAPGDARVESLILLNPWVHTETGQARAYLRHYYTKRLVSRGFWRKLMAGRMGLLKSLRSFAGVFGRAYMGRTETAEAGGEETPGLVPMLHGCLARFDGGLCVITSEDDMTAAEFRDLVADSWQWRTLMCARQAEFHLIPGANHTFSRRPWKDEVARLTLAWMRRD
ncbi:MAG TPA: hydrolase 1, exosortase A system-associated [Gammaproteobacteria bacterium]|nr:hydrolase 1, exosortase A system-associated [Gammaproteobacteria bacterium]